jgi:hypothetical protein
VAAVNLLRTRLAVQWTLNSLADEVYLSRSQLSLSFAATVGMSPMAYLRQDAGATDGVPAGLHGPVDRDAPAAALVGRRRPRY